MTTLMKVPLYKLEVGESFALDGEVFALVDRFDGEVTISNGMDRFTVPSGTMVEVDR